MMILLSPSKTLDEKGKPLVAEFTAPDFLPESDKLINILKEYSPANLSTLMGISDTLAALNVSRFQSYKIPFTPANAKQAIFLFKGDVYAPIEVESFQSKHFEFAQKNVRILSGLYGLLKPLDLMQPYRLEMGTKLANPKGKNLYDFWGDTITDSINAQKPTMVVNLASEEYFKAVKYKKLTMPCIHIVFKENQKGRLNIIGLFAKKARGMMTNYAIKHKINNPKDLMGFSEGGYQFTPKLSDDNHWVFVR
jgi:uncharacterized protein